MSTDIMTYLPEPLPAIERLGLAFDEMDLGPVEDPKKDQDESP